MTWGAVGGAAVGAAGNMIGGSKSSKKAAKAQQAAMDQQKEAAAYQQMWTQQNRDAANQMNRENVGLTNSMSRDNAQWANDINKANRIDSETINRQNSDYANIINMQNRDASNAITRGNAEWANQQNINNAGLEQSMNRENLDYANAANRENQDYAQAKNWESALRGQQINQGALDTQTAGNRLNTTNGFGGSVTYGPDGSVQQRLGGGDQDLMGTIYDKSNSIMQGMGEGFDVNGDVMNAYKAINQPLVDQQRNRENARLAAMGLATGSGTAWGSAQDALNRNQVNSDQNAILQGFQADQALRASNRADLGAMGGVRSGIQQGLAQPDYWKQGNAALINAPQQQAVNMGAVNSQIGNVNAWQSQMPAYQQATSQMPGVSSWNPSIGSVSAGGTPSLDPTSAQNYGQATGQSTQNMWNGIGNAAGDMTSSIIGGKNKQNSANQALAREGAADFSAGWNSSNYG